MFPINEVGIASGLFFGVLFGYILENAGFGSPCKLTAQFHFRDWAVFRVMFTAILVAAMGLYLLRTAGLLDEEAIFIPTTYFWATLAGGVLVGAGFAVGGYCPGTSMVALASGRLDALVFIAGLVAGTLGFAGIYDGLEAFLQAGQGAEAQTLPELLGLPEPLVLALLLAAAVAGFKWGARVERRGRGPLDAQETLGLKAAPGACPIERN
jgi:hypothetical protein